MWPLMSSMVSNMVSKCNKEKQRGKEMWPNVSVWFVYVRTVAWLCVLCLPSVSLRLNACIHLCIWYWLFRDSLTSVWISWGYPSTQTQGQTLTFSPYAWLEKSVQKSPPSSHTNRKQNKFCPPPKSLADKASLSCPLIKQAMAWHGWLAPR